VRELLVLQLREPVTCGSRFIQHLADHQNIVAFVQVLTVLALMAFRDARKVVHASALWAQRQQYCPRALSESLCSIPMHGSLPSSMRKDLERYNENNICKRSGDRPILRGSRLWAPRARIGLAIFGIRLALGRRAPDLHLAYEADSSP